MCPVYLMPPSWGCCGTGRLVRGDGQADVCSPQKSAQKEGGLVLEHEGCLGHFFCPVTERVLWRPLFPPCQELVWFAGVSVTTLGERWVRPVI